MERKTVKKWFWVWDYEKEERWLNGMAQSGWLLDGVGYCTYHFVSCEPGEYTVRLEMRDYSDDYIQFVGETGAEYVGRMVKWLYFRKKAAYGEFEMLSDLDSRMDQLNRIGKILAILAGANLLIGMVNLFNPVVPLGWVNLLCATLLMYGLGRIHGKKEELEQKRFLIE